MDSSLTRVILATLGGYLILLLILTLYDWIKEEFPRHPPRQIASERIRHPLYHEEALNALNRFSKLKTAEREAVIKNLKKNLIPMAQWANDLEHSDFQIICMGEFHEESTRRFLAKEFFSSINTDTLFLEATPDELKKLIKEAKTGRAYFPLLDADIMEVLRAVKKKNQDTRILGIEETDDQQKSRPGHLNSRDQSIASNFWKKYKKGDRHIILFGALHCTKESNWLFRNLWDQAGVPLKEQMLNLNVLGEHQKGSLEAFVYFLDEIGIKKQSLVIPDARGLSPLIYQWFPSLNRQILEKYRALIIFREA